MAGITAGMSMCFLQDLSLVVQSLSYHRAGIRSFSPISKDAHVQAWVRAFLLDHALSIRAFTATIIGGVRKSIGNYSIVRCEVNRLVLYRLSGHGIPGWTWQQLAGDTQGNGARQSISIYRSVTYIIK